MLQEGHIVIGKQGEVATLKHAGCKISHDRFGLDMKVAQHLVGPPAADELDAASVNVCTKEGHGPRGSQGASRHVVGKEAIHCTQDSGGLLQGLGEVTGGDAV